MKQTLFVKQLAGYFDIYLPQNRKCSRNTIASYADGFILFFEFLQEQKGKAHYLIDYSDLTPQVFDEFVLWMQNKRQYSAASQKQRMSAITSFLKYASRREMSALNALNGASSAQTPKIPQAHFPYFSVDEIKILLRLPQCIGKAGCRDIVLLSLMYDAGARAQEVCDLCIGDITIAKTSKIKIHGKGNKTREIPISQDVAKLIKKYMKERSKNFTDNRNEAFFPSQRAEKMTTACIRNLVHKYVTIARAENPTLFTKEGYSPHSFRHSKAVHMLEAGIPLIYIRNFLGHETVSTTEVYARISQAAVTKILAERNVANPVPKVAKNISDNNDDIPDFLKNAR
jgi:integrase/recombinase XerD